MERTPIYARYADRMLENNSLQGQRGGKLLPACCSSGGFGDDRTSNLVPGQFTTPLQPCSVAPAQPRPKVWRKVLISAERPLLGLLLGEQIAIELPRDDRHIT